MIPKTVAVGIQFSAWPRESGNPGHELLGRQFHFWIPACAGLSGIPV